MGTKILIIIGLSLLLCGCVQNQPRKGGGTSVSSGFGFESPATLEIIQSQDPAKESSGSQSRSQTRDGDVSIPLERTTKETLRDGTVKETKEVFAIGKSKESIEVKTQTKVGPSFWDSSRDMAAKLTAMRPIQMIGVGLMLAGIASLFYAPLRILLGGGKQLPVAIAGVGLLLVFAPQVIAGNETLIIIGSFVAMLIYWLSIRLTRKEAEADLIKNKL